jgi:hypothetical protein
MLNSARIFLRSIPLFLPALDGHLLDFGPRRELAGWRRFVVEFFYFGVKEARACLFVVLFFTAVFSVPRGGMFGIPRYDALLLIALAIQAWMVWAKLETWDELKAICLFHVIGFVLEVFKTSGGIQSWAYPDFAYSKILGVPLFSGFMYAAAAMSSRRGDCWACEFGIIRRTGWQGSMRWSSMRISLRTTTSAIIGGISRPAP